MKVKRLTGSVMVTMMLPIAFPSISEGADAVTIFAEVRVNPEAGTFETGPPLNPEFSPGVSALLQLRLATALSFTEQVAVQLGQARRQSGSRVVTANISYPSRLGPGSVSEIRTYGDSRWPRKFCASGIVVRKDATSA